MQNKLCLSATANKQGHWSSANQISPLKSNQKGNSLFNSRQLEVSNMFPDVTNTQYHQLVCFVYDVKLRPPGYFSY